MRKFWLGLCVFGVGCGGSVEPVDLTGNLYAVDYSDAEMDADFDLGTALTSLGGGVALIGVSSVSEDSISMHATMAVENSDPYSQDFCGMTVPLPESSLDGDTFSFGPETVEWKMYEDSNAVFDDVASSGVVNEDGTLITDISMSFGFDLRLSLESFGLEEVEDMCNITEALGLNCIPCADGIVGCIAAEATNLTANVLPTPFEVVDTPYDHPECTLTGDE